MGKDDRKGNHREETLADTMKDVVVSIIIVAVLFLSLYAYAQTWPPIVVIESGSMQHGDESHIGVIDTGDIVIVKKIYSPEDVVSYVEGRESGYERYGDYGDVVIYNCDGRLIIHRAMVYLTWNGHRWVIRGFEDGNYPSWLSYNQTPFPHIVIRDVGYAHKDVIINVDVSHLNPTTFGREGFITMGDNNLAEVGSTAYDQNTAIGPLCSKLVNYDMIVGVARGELPWFGAIKLYFTHTNVDEIPHNTKVNLVVSLALIIGGSFAIDYAIANREKILERIRKLRRKSEE